MFQRKGVVDVAGGAVSVVLVLASLHLSMHPLAAQSPASDQYEPNEPTTSAPASPANPGAETNTTARGEVTEVTSDNPEPASDPNGDQVSSVTLVVPDCNGQEAMLDDRAAELLRLHNEFRAAHGMEPFCVQKNLMTAAQGHAEDMLRRGYYRHDTPEGIQHDKRI